MFQSLIAPFTTPDQDCAVLCRDNKEEERNIKEKRLKFFRVAYEIFSLVMLGDCGVGLNCLTMLR